MLPAHLYNSYDRYKRETAAMLQWLETTAARHDHPNPGTSTIGDIMESARYIAGLGHRVKIPASILQGARNAIALRLQFSRYFEKGEKASNERHLHFVGILQKILEILGADESLETSGSDPVNQSLSTNINRYSYLDIEEDVNSDDTESVSSLESLPADMTTPIDADAKTSPKEDSKFKEATFAAWCLMSDSHAIRKYLQELWNGFKDGTTEIISISLVTDIAIGFVKTSIEAFHAEHPHFMEKMNATLIPMYKDIMDKSDAWKPQIKRGILATDIGTAIDFWIYANGHEIFPIDTMNSVGCTSTWRGLIEIQSQLPSDWPKVGGDLVPDAISMQRWPAIQFQPFTRGHNAVEVEAAYQKDLAVLRGSIAILSKVFWHEPRVEARNYLSKAVLEIIEQRKISTWICFAFQVYLDIKEIMWDAVDMPLQQAKLCAPFTKSRVEVPRERTHDYDDTRLETMHKLLHGIDRDTVLEGIPSRSVRETYREWDYLRSHPILTGLTAASIRKDTQLLTFPTVAQADILTIMFYLYDALQTQGLIDEPWEDYDLIWKYYDKRRFYFGSSPENLQHSMDKCSLALGYRTRNFRNGRGVPQLLEKRLVRGLADGVDAFEKTTIARLMEFMRHELNVDTIQQLLREIKVPKASVKVRTAGSMTMLEVLQQLTSSLQDEEVPIRFDWIGLKMRMISCIEQLVPEFKDPSVEIGPLVRGFIENEDYDNVAYACIAELSVQEQPGGETSRFTRGVAKVFNKFIAKDGNRGSREMKYFRRNGIRDKTAIRDETVYSSGAVMFGIRTMWLMGLVLFVGLWMGLDGTG